MQSLGKVGVLFGGRSAEREVSLMSGNGVLAALRSKGVDAHPFDPAERSVAELQAEKFDRVFIALHGRYGEDGSLQGVLEQCNIPYTGSGVMACAIGMDKIFTKRIWQTHGISTPGYAVLNAQSDLQTLAQNLGLPMILKPPHEGSTIGITKVNHTADIQQAYTLAAQFDEVVLAEEFIEGREFTVAILGRGEQAYALPVIEIVAPEGNYDYQNKYFTDDTKYQCPAPLPAELTATIQKMAVDAYRALDCEGWARIDVLVRESDQRPFLLEINTSPGMTGHSLVPMAAKAVGMSYEDLCVEILKTARLKISGEKS
ncbi:D-alanine--D-alanine ligase [Undibacterium sp. CY7W]|uniref:D-alanine--D-alanine ligase n=2 Tax=Undibacterium rugosum TaxID=2762291 RepID=A0A923I706_9BURK|nr:D-alanine--D-alanine ligase [Undibacterium rugosum]MBR7778412.1 D-alanine--D-alanine ligase [Undibacterium rugosum]